MISVPRKIEWLNSKTGEWLPTHMENLEIGDRFRMFEPNGHFVEIDFGQIEFVVDMMPTIQCRGSEEKFTIIPGAIYEKRKA